jgi:Tfp pilus assembly protein PilX
MMNQISSFFVRKVRVKDDRGIALVVAIALMAIVGILMITMVTVAINESRASGRDRQRSSAVMTAEGQVDSLISQIQSAPVAQLPCPAGSTTASIGTDTMTITNTVTYSTAAGAPVTCLAVQTGTQADLVAIKSVSKSRALAGQPAAIRTVETLVKLTPAYNNTLSKAFYSYGDITFAGTGSITGPNADLYTNGSVTCNNGTTVDGSIYAQGSVSFNNTNCRATVDVRAKSGFNTNDATVGGNIFVSNGSISMLHGHLGGAQARARGTVTGDACSPAGKCFPGDMAVAAPPSEAFPQINSDSATINAWAAAGYTSVVTLPNSSYPCGMYGGSGSLNGQVDNAGKWIIDALSAAGTMPKTVLVDKCPSQPVKFQANPQVIALENDLAIFSDGGFDFSGPTTIKSATADQHNLYLIQPYAAVSAHPCTSQGIAFNSSVTVQNTISDLLYSPCTIRTANLSSLYGQVYSGGPSEIDNGFNMTFRSLPVFGLSVAGGAINKYSADILYMRETTP